MTTMVEQTVADVMTRCPLSIPDDTSFHSVATILSRNRFSAVPVVDGRGLLVGVVSELDLIRVGLHANRDLRRVTARDVMGPATTVETGEPLTTAARRLSDAGIRRLFIVTEGSLVGVLSRRDLLRAYVRDDDDIREEVERRVMPILPGRHVELRVVVEDGEVLLLGRVERRSQLVGVDDVVGSVPGVVMVRNRIGYQWNDRPERSTR